MSDPTEDMADAEDTDDTEDIFEEKTPESGVFPAKSADGEGDEDDTAEFDVPVVHTCPACGESVTDADRFCEACGASLPLAATSLADTGATITSRASDALTCPNCHAGAVDATADGYCGLCGRRWSPVREHDEWVDGPVAGVTDRGTHHWRNEDAVGVAAVDGGFVLVVCDGVSASQEPQVVSQAAVDAALPVLRDAAEAEGADVEDLQAAMVEATAAAQKAAAAVDSDPAMAFGPGACTYVAVVVRGEQAVFGSVGDSRAYWVDASGATQVSTDDSLAAQLVAAGAVAEEDAMAAPGAHTITKWLGADSIDNTPELTPLVLPAPGLVVLVSDGLWNYTPTPADLAALVGSPLGEEASLDLARRMVAFAEDAGGADNITVAIAPHRLTPPAAAEPDGATDPTEPAEPGEPTAPADADDGEEES